MIATNAKVTQLLICLVVLLQLPCRVAWGQYEGLPAPVPYDEVENELAWKRVLAHEAAIKAKKEQQRRQLLIEGPNLPGQKVLESQRYGEARIVHALIVVDTRGRNAKALGIPVDGERIVSALKQGFPDDPYRLRLTLLEGKNVSRESILAYYQNLKSTDRDVLLFYYSGHGGAVQRGYDSHHFLFMSTGMIWREEIHALMQRQSSQLRVVLTDCCANYPTIQAARSACYVDRHTAAPNPIKVRVHGRRPELQNVRHLLLRHYGVVDMNASMMGDPASGNRASGGHFTNAVVQWFRSNINRDFFESSVSSHTWLATGAFQNPGGAPFGFPPGVQKPSTLEYHNVRPIH